MMKKITHVVLFFTLMFSGAIAFGASQSQNYQMPAGAFNYGGATGYSTNYQISNGVFDGQPAGMTKLESGNYQLFPDVLETNESTPSCGLIINGGSARTGSTNVTLGLICSDPDGCTKVQISNNGVSFEEFDYTATTRDWQVTTTDGTKRVYVKYKDTAGNWSGVCAASIILDATGSGVTASPVGGTFMSAQTVTLTASEPSTIYYTTDGSDPSTSPTRIAYSTPIPVAANDTDLKFYGVDITSNAGSVNTEHYTICNGGNFTVTGTITDAATGKPVPYARVKLTNASEVTTDANGVYTISGLATGHYAIDYVKAAVAGYATYQTKLTLCNQAGTITNNIVLTRNDSTFGTDTQSGYSWGSVNTSTGNYVYRATDLAIPGRGMPFSFERTFNSLDGNNGPLGYGWTHTYNITLTDNTTDVTVRWGDGKTATWTTSDGTYTPQYGVFDTLTKDATYYTVKLKNMTMYRFDATTKLLAAIVDENGNTMSFTASGSNIGSVTDTVGRTITFSYDTNSRITAVSDPTGRSALFSYDVNGNLVSSTNLAGNTTTYTYDANHLLLTITDPRGSVAITNTYDSDRWVVISQKDALGAETLYSYDAANRTTQIIDPLGNSSYHQFDERLRLTRETDARGNSAVYVYNSIGTIQSVTDKNGNVTSYEYDASGNVLTKTEPLGKVSSALYNPDNNPTEKTDARGYKTTFEYSADGKGNLLKVNNPAEIGGSTSYSYDVYGQVQTVTDAEGGVTTNYYDTYGNKVQVIDAMGFRHTFDYDYVGRKVAEHHYLDAATITSTAYEYDARDNLVSITDASGGVSTFKYDANGNKTEHVDARKNRIKFAYDAKNRLVSKTSPLNELETYTYDEMDRRTAVKNPRGYTTNAYYDSMGNVTYESDALGNVVQHEYDANGKRTSNTDAMGNVTVFAYDALNRLASKTGLLGYSESYTYDLSGNRLTMTNAEGKTTSFAYDALNRLVSTTDARSNTTVNEYDRLGRLKKVTDARSNQTSFVYDALGRLTTVTDAAGGVVTATYDALGNRLTLKDSRENTTTYTYDLLGRLVRETDPLGNAKLFHYDAVGNLTTFIDASGTTNYTYDANNRLTDIAYPDVAVSYTYDSNGNRLSTKDNMGTTSFAYDRLDRVSSITDPFGMIVGYTYDPNGKRTSTKYPGNRPVFYYYDELNRLASVEDWGGIVTSYRYDKDGRMIGQTMGNGATVEYTYDEAGRLTDKVDKTSGGAVIAAYHYELDAAGNRTGMTMDQPLVPTPNAESSSFTHNAGNQVTASGSKAYTYDGRGNRATRQEGALTTQYMYNFANRLTRVINGTSTHEYRYSSDGKRLSAVIDGVETRYLLDLNGGMENVLADMTSANVIQKYYVYGDGLLYSVDKATGARLYYHYDPLGSTVAITDADGNITDKYAYLPYGELNQSETTHTNPFTYVGKYGVMKEPNGLYFMRARFYDPETRRFMSVDPVKGEMKDTQTLNFFTYVANRPANGIDPDGRVSNLGDLENIVNLADAIKSGNSDKIEEAVDSFNPIYMANKGAMDANAGNAREDNQDIAYQFSYTAQKIYNFFAKIDYSKFSFGKKKNTEVIQSYGNELTEERVIVQYEFVKSGPQSSFECKLEAQRQILTNPDIDKETKSAVEKQINKEIKKKKKKAKEQAKWAREQEEKRLKALYENYMISLSKYDVLVYDLNKLPSFNSGNRSRAGAYGK